MGTYNAKLFSLHIQPGQDGLAAAGALLRIIKPIIRYRKRHGMCLQNGPTGKNGIAMVARFVMLSRKLRKFQAEHMVHAQPGCDLRGGIPVAGAAAAHIQLIGQQQIYAVNCRMMGKKFQLFFQMHAPFKIKAHHAQGIHCAPFQPIRRPSWVTVTFCAAFSSNQR